VLGRSMPIAASGRARSSDWILNSVENKKLRK
jgi:hypothetical protein